MAKDLFDQHCVERSRSHNYILPNVQTSRLNLFLLIEVFLKETNI